MTWRMGLVTIVIRSSGIFRSTGTPPPILDTIYFNTVFAKVWLNDRLTPPLRNSDQGYTVEVNSKTITFIEVSAVLTKNLEVLC